MFFLAGTFDEAKEKAVQWLLKEWPYHIYQYEITFLKVDLVAKQLLDTVLYERVCL